MKTKTTTNEDLLQAIEKVLSITRQEIEASELRNDIKREEMEMRINDNARKLNSEVLSRFDA